MTDRETTLDRAAFVVLAACLGLVQFNLLAAETLFGVAALMWLAIAVRDGGRPVVPSFFYALAGYAAWTLKET